MKRLVLCGAVVLLGIGQAEGAIPWSGNGHFYEPVASPSSFVTWDEASAAATEAGGYLATLTSAEENAFVFSLVTDAEYWGGQVFDHGPWLGGLQSPPTTIPDANWQWVTGEPWDYENWRPPAPSDGNGHPQDRLIFYKFAGQWTDFSNDFRGDGPLPAYIIEYDTDPDIDPHPGDANLDGVTDLSDFNIWNANKFTAPTDWQRGDFDGNGGTGLGDFNIWNAHKFTTAGGGAAPAPTEAPEPSTLLMLTIIGAIFGGIAWRRKRGAA